MIALDTNVLVRYIVQDDLVQAAHATGLIEARCTTEEPGLVATIVVGELAWVLGRGYGYSRAQVADVVRAILSADELEVEAPEMAWRSLRMFEAGKADLADYLIGNGNRERGAEATFTFDHAAAESDLFSLLATEESTG